MLKKKGNKGNTGTTGPVVTLTGCKGFRGISLRSLELRAKSQMLPFLKLP